MATTTSVSSLLGFVLFVSVGILPSISNPTIDHEVTLWKQGKTSKSFFCFKSFFGRPNRHKGWVSGASQGRWFYFGEGIYPESRQTHTVQYSLIDQKVLQIRFFNISTWIMHISVRIKIKIDNRKMYWVTCQSIETALFKCWQNVFPLHVIKAYKRSIPLFLKFIIVYSFIYLFSQ